MNSPSRNRIMRALEDARERALAARRTGDNDGYQYARAEAHRLSRILAEG